MIFRRKKLNIRAKGAASVRSVKSKRAKQGARIGSGRISGCFTVPSDVLGIITELMGETT